MSGLMEENEQVINIEFRCKKHKQRLLIHALLNCSQLSIERIASIIKVPSKLLLNVYNGYRYLHPNKSIQLMQLYIICFSE